MKRKGSQRIEREEHSDGEENRGSAKKETKINKINVKKWIWVLIGKWALVSWADLCDELN